MKKFIVIALAVLIMVGCSKSDTYGLGEYNDRKYVNGTFSYELDIPEDFSFLTADELLTVNTRIQSESQDIELAKYRNKVLDLTHVDGSRVTAFVDSTPDTQKNAEAESIRYVEFIDAQKIPHTVKYSTETINDVEFVRLDFTLDFDQRQINLITVRNDKLINIQYNYHVDNVTSVEPMITINDSE